MSTDLPDKVFRALNDAGIKAGDRVVAGISGGPDSTCLLAILSELRDRLSLKLLAAHLEHGIRGTESVKDMEFVQEFCRSHGVPETDLRAHLPPDTTEEAARKARLGFFHLLCSAWKAKALLLAHHADDLVETMLFRMLRGTPPEGLPGFGAEGEMQGVKVLRPLVDVRKADITGFLELRRVPFRVDHTNTSGIYVRNIIRRKVIPSLERIVPRAGDSLFHLALEMEEIGHFVRCQANKAMDKIPTHRMPGLHVLDAERFVNLSPVLCRCLLHQLLPDTGRFDHKRITELGKCGEITLPGGISARRDEDQIFLCDAKRLPVIEKPLELPVPGSARLPDGSRIKATRTKITGAEPPRSGPLVEYLSSSALETGTLVVRNREEGDRFHPLGMSGSMKLQDFLVNERLPKEVRSCLPLVLSGGEIAWVCGLRMSERFRLEDNSGDAVKLEIVPRRKSFVRVLAGLLP